MTKSKFLTAGAALTIIGCGGASVADAQAQRQRQISASAQQQAAQQHPQILEQFGGQETAARSAYVQRVGAKVVAQTGIANAGQAYRITTLNSPVINAFAVPGGYLYITRQLVGLMDDEAELASVLGHEAGHIAARHSQGRQRTGLLSQLLSVGVALVTGSGSLAQIAGQGAQLFTLRYSRGQEFEADDLGVRYIAAAGYDPRAAADMLASLGAASSLEARVAGRDERSTPSWARTHPLSEDRVRRATQRAQATGRVGAGARNRDQFLAAIDGILVDDDPRQGVIDGSTFRHPDLRLRFTIPQGFQMQNGTRAVTIAGQSGQAQFAGGGAGADLRRYIGQVYQALGQGQTSIQYAEPQTTTINGIPAAYTVARVNSQGSGQVDVGVFAFNLDGRGYHFATITRAGGGFGPFEPMIGSFARLSASDAAAIRPRVIDVVTVRPGDTVEKLAARMAYSDGKVERFRVLNSIAQEGGALPVGSKVKLVVYGARS